MNEQSDAGAPAQAHCDRRTVILGAGQVAAAGIAATLAAATPTRASAEGAPGQECMSIVYQNGKDIRFDFDYYEKTHMRKIMDAYGKSISRFELRRGPVFTQILLADEKTFIDLPRSPIWLNHEHEIVGAAVVAASATTGAT